MKQSTKFILASALIGAGVFGVGAIIDAVTRQGTLPPYDTVTDVGKVPVISSAGVIGWTGSNAITGSIHGPGLSASGDLVGFSGTTGQTVFDTGILYTNVTLGAASAVSGDIAMFSGSTGKTLADSGLLATNLAFGATASTVTANDLVAYAGTGGRQTKDSGIPLANVVLVSRAVQAGTGLTVTNSGLLSADITMSIGPNQLQLAMLPTGVNACSISAVTGATGTNYSSLSAGNDGNVLRRASSVLGFGTVNLSDSTNAVSGVLPVGVGGTSASTAASGFQNLSPLTTKGDLISYSTSPQRVAAGTDNYGLVANSGATSGLIWTYDRAGIPGATGATAGLVGEVISLRRPVSSQTSLTTATTCNVGAATCPSTGGTQSIILTQGVWLIEASAFFSTAATTRVSNMAMGVTKTSVTFPSDVIGAPTGCEYQANIAFGTTAPSGLTPGSAQNVIAAPPFICGVTAPTMALFLIEQATFDTSTMAGGGELVGYRIR